MCCALVLTGARAAAVAEDDYPVRWTGTQAVVTLPERIGAADGGRVSGQLAGLVDRGPAVLIADMTATVSCDDGGADALRQAYQRASGNGTQLRVAVTAQDVRRVLDAAGLDRLVAIYPSVQAAAAGTSAGVTPLVSRQTRQRGDNQVSRSRAAGQGGDRLAAAFGPAVLWGMLNALADGVVLADDAGFLVLANRRAEELFGYAHGELTGQRVESLVPDRLRAAHVAQRAGYAREPTAREMGARARLAGLRKDGTTFPVRISLSPVQTTTGRFTMAVIRDSSDDRPPADLGGLARAAAAAEDAHQGRELLGQVVDGLFRVGLSLQTAADLPDEIAVQRIADALQHVDEVIDEIRDHVFAGLGDVPPPHAPRDGSR
jgi:PAS domain S-box-containing protein